MYNIKNVNCDQDIRLNCRFYINTAALHMSSLRTTFAGIVIQLICLMLLGALDKTFSFVELIVYGMSFLLVAFSYPHFSSLENSFAKILKWYSGLIVSVAFLGLIGVVHCVQSDNEPIISFSLKYLSQIQFSFRILWYCMLGEVVLGMVFCLVSWTAFSLSEKHKFQQA